MTVKTINRDAGDKSKGFRLQRLRALKLLLDQIEEKGEGVCVFASTEYLDDVYIKTVTHEDSIVLTEGDKNYDESKSFSFMSKEVTNSLIIFLDNWLTCDFSESLYYCFYTNVGYTKERQVAIIKNLQITLPEQPILEYLINKNLNSNIIDCIKKRLIYEYTEQYSKRKEEGYLKVIKSFTDEKWRKFLMRIDWKFGQYDDKELEKSLVVKLSSRSFFEHLDITNKEKLVIDILLSQFAEKEVIKDPMVKNVSVRDVENVFLKISKDVIKKDDPIYDVWGSLEPPKDTRGLKQKIIDVDKDYRKIKIGIKARQVAAIKAEYESLTEQEQGSYRYRVFEACQEKLVQLIDEDKAVDIDIWLEEMFKESKKHIEDKSKDFSYAITSDDSIRKTILELIDSCFLSFDEEGFYYDETI